MTLQWGRGWTAAEGQAEAGGQPAHEVASMGPRLDSRGRGHRLLLPSHPQRRFNGAAAGQPRKGAGVEHRVRCTYRFNGAAAGQPRKADPRPQPTHSCLASMGPRLDSRGRKGTTEPQTFFDWASMGPRLDSRGRRSRKEGSVYPNPASMGPRLDSRGRCACIWAALYGHRASMGPRLDSRGRGRLLQAAGAGCGLQWGRGWTAAEGRGTHA